MTPGSVLRARAGTGAGSAGAEGTTPYRPEIDGLRALAVVAVVAYHARVPGFSGGFVGVDVFFVISGFLITGLLIREVEQEGRVSLGGFYGRRFRRILPMSALVCVATVAVGWVVLSRLLHHDLAADALATSTFTINIRLAVQQLDYLRSGLAPSAFQQFWSLAVEEQFYLCWPLLMGLALRGRTPRRRAGVVVLALCSASFVLALVWVTSEPAWAFFSLPTRAWQLGLGALLALGGPRLARVLPWTARPAFAFAGVAAIVVSVVTYGQGTPWPGWPALVPTLGTILVLTGASTTDRSVRSTLAARAPRWLGTRSYSWYLWHWPAMVFVAAGLERSVGGWPALAAAGATLALSGVTYRWVEQPVRRAPRLVASPRLSVTLGLGVTVVLAALFAGLLALPDDVVGPGASAAALARRDVDARRLDQAALVEQVPSNIRPALADADQDFPPTYDDGCHRALEDTAPVLCWYGDTQADPIVVLIGDSHAAQWVPALDALGRRHHFRLLPLSKSSCPAADLQVFDAALNREYAECDEWRERVYDLVDYQQPDLVIVTNTGHYVPIDAAPDGEVTDDQWREAFASTLGRLSAAAPTILLGDTPWPKAWTPTCLSNHLDDARHCVLQRDELADRHFEDLEEQVAADADVPFVPTTDLLCGDQSCPVIVGDVLVYRDDSHITSVYSDRLSARLADLIDEVEPDGPVAASP